MNQIQLDKEIDQFLRKKLAKAELKEMGIEPRPSILKIRNLIEKHLLVILDSIFIDVPRGWDNFSESFYCWRKLVFKENRSVTLVWEIYFWEAINNYRD